MDSLSKLLKTKQPILAENNKDVQSCLNKILRLQKQKNYGYVYLIVDDNNRYKLGASKNTTHRRSAHQVSNPEKLKILFAIQVEDKYQVEKAIKQVLIPYKINGEWYTCPIYIFIEAFKSQSYIKWIHYNDPEYKKTIKDDD